ncbi:MAG TPA: hypothetical protein VFW19_10330 [Allosphingosinicella sp.]|nr:hypothetical protein [Allosphingosinicella sp.]
MSPEDEMRADALLHELLAAPEREPDEVFTRRIERLVLAERSLRSARRRVLRQFVAELAALASLAVAVQLIRRLAPPDSEGAILSSPPAIGVLMLLLVWLCAATRTEFLPADH